MRTRVIGTSLVGCTVLVLSLTAPAHATSPDLGRQTLAAGDGWASEGAGTTGGAAADAAHTHTVRTWAEFKAALAAGGTAPKIIRVVGTLNATEGGCEAFEADGYDFTRYLADYDPAVWGYDTPVSGPQEDLRAASAKKQAASIKAYVPANTTIVGVGKHAGITGGSLQIQGVDNVIVRNLTVESPLDCFPQWDPTDGSTGAWNSEYDAMVVYGSTHVWIDHNTFTDGRYPDSSLPRYYGEIYQQHDGELDIVRGANHVTASWNVFADHDKTLMIGNSDSAAATDAGKLKVTLHHNLFTGVVERAPRVRFGQVDAYNNHFVVKEGQSYGYSFGIGLESRLYAEKNAFTLPDGVGAGKILKKWKEAPLTAVGNRVNGRTVDLIAEHNALNPGNPLQSGAGWTPALRARVDDPRAVPGLVGQRAGAGKVC
ncbi:pectate lyase [Streptomyces sp. CB03234]|uniref:pectate lyase family protein n=1 Tax=Streptomyces sp. (strain CB03234) TaxID=1703937 RepID=UPI00093D1E38|nr:pectate lyase [Streptomyces sp. CB03234]OKK08545.1 pectate lyase [Streptomyces sp. CB03234]